VGLKPVFVAEQYTMASEEDSDFSRSFQNAVRYALDTKFKEIQTLKPSSSRRSFVQVYPAE